jgi:hypothetical protein
VFDINQKVAWTSESGGHAKVKRGMIIAIVPPAKDPRACIPPGYSFKNHRVAKWRKDVSYLVRIEGSKKLYWPVVDNLVIVEVAPLAGEPKS